jgi:two-component system, LytTR family, response regulator
MVLNKPNTGHQWRRMLSLFKTMARRDWRIEISLRRSPLNRNGMTRIRTLIVDDEKPARDLLRSMLAVFGRIEIVGESADGETALSLIREAKPDLLFLDVEMPRLNGVEVVAELAPDTTPLVVFVTAFDRYALRAFEVDACDYLLKPFDEERLTTTVERVLDRYDRSMPSMQAALQSLVAQLRGATNSQIVVKVDGRHVFLDSDEVDWIEVAGKDLKLHVGQTVLQVREAMTSLARRLPPQFLQVHRSAVINRSRLRQMQPWFQGEYLLILRDGTRVVTGRRYRESVQTLVHPGRIG